jgi:cell division protein FtsW
MPAARGANAKAGERSTPGGAGGTRPGVGVHRGATKRSVANGGRLAGDAPHARTGAQQPLEHRILLTATLCLLAFGAVMVYSASAANALLEGSRTGSGYLVKFVVFGAIGLALMHYLARHGVARVQGLVGPFLAVSFVLVAAVHIPHVGVSVNGARRWIGSGVLQFEPAELLKLALVLYAATLLARRPRCVHDLRTLCRPLLTVVGAACLLVVTQPDIGTALVIAFTTAALLIAAGIPMRNFAIVAGCALAVVALYALARPYARERLTSFIDPWAHRTESGFQAVQGQIAIGSGGLFGVGPGQSVQKAFYLPEAQTDFIFAVIAEELGVVGVYALLFLYGLIGYAGLRAARRARSSYRALIGVGMTTLILSQAVLNMFAVLGLAPLTGVPLPFVSYGSSSLVVMLAAMGLLLNVASDRNRLTLAHDRSGETLASGRSRETRAVSDARARKTAGLSGERSVAENRDSRRRDRRARGAGAGGR